jgi:hypothetical protein
MSRWDLDAKTRQNVVDALARDERLSLETWKGTSIDAKSHVLSSQNAMCDSGDYISES